ncbi:hypothetical protein ABBQ38_002085 [Trebouxia sp. C0009 RCD-2024]
MVNALQGVLLVWWGFQLELGVSGRKGLLTHRLSCSDIPSKEYILRLNEEKSKNEKFLLEELDDTHLFVKHVAVEELQRKLKEFQEQNTYEVPRREHT